MGYQIAAIFTIVYAILMMRLVLRWYGSGSAAGYQTSMSEVFWVATIWGLSGGMTMYLNPDTQHMWNPAISLPDKLMYWLLALLFAGAIIRTVFTIRPIGKKILTALAGLVLLGLFNYALSALFGVRQVQ